MTSIYKTLATAAIAISIAVGGSVSNASSYDSHGKWGKGESDGDSDEYVVITLATDPVYDDPEPACVALQMGMNLLSSTVPDSNMDPVSVEPAEKVVLFPTIGGVELINPANSLTADVCLTMGGMDSLHDLLYNFVKSGGEIVVCPLCAMTRNIKEPTYGTMGSGEAIHELFMDADKVITF